MTARLQDCDHSTADDQSIDQAPAGAVVDHALLPEEIRRRLKQAREEVLAACAAELAALDAERA